MSTTPASTVRGSASATPAASVIGQTSKHLPHWVQASAISAARPARADSKVLVVCSFTATLYREFVGWAEGVSSTPTCHAVERQQLP